MHKQSSGLSKFNADFIRRSTESTETILVQQEKIRGCALPPAYESLRKSISPWPVIINEKTVQEMKVACKRLTGLLYKSLNIISEEYSDFSKLIYGDDITEIIRQNREHWELDLSVGRYDAVMMHGTLKLLEYNSGTNIGGWHLYRFTETYKEIVGAETELICIPILEMFLNSIYQMVHAKINFSEPSINLLFVIDSNEALEDIQTSLPFFNMAMDAMDIRMEIFWTLSTDNIDFAQEGVLFDGIRIHALSFPVANFDFSNDKIDKMVAYHRSGKVVFPDMPAFLVAGYKSNFANLHWLNSRGKFSKQDSELINKIVPATYYLSDEINTALGNDIEWLYRDVENNKDRYVIKRDGFFGGDHVYVGLYTTEQAWRNILAVARRSNSWIVQQYCPSDHFYAPDKDGLLGLHDYIFGFFNFAGQYGGAGIRLMKTDTGSGVVNSAKGAQYTAIFEVRQQSIVI